jgi:hypothetical protein
MCLILKIASMRHPDAPRFHQRARDSRATSGPREILRSASEVAPLRTTLLGIQIELAETASGILWVAKKDDYGNFVLDESRVGSRTPVSSGVE